MKKFVIAFLNYHDNLITQTIVEGSDPIEVAVNYLNDLNDGWDLKAESFSTIDDVAEYCFYSDCNISVIEVP